MKSIIEKIVEGIVIFFVFILPVLTVILTCTGLDEKIFPNTGKEERHVYDEEEERQQALEWEYGGRDQSDCIP